MSRLTVPERLKSLFEKMGVASRQQVVAPLRSLQVRLPRRR
jgi:DNA-binding NarL/FixJ family response regulator